MHVEPHDGGCRLWIHAPTVAERLNGGSSIDQWLQEQGEALCLGDTWQPLLSNNLTQASKFSPGTTQEAISLRVDVDADGHLGEWEFQLSTVRPVASVTSEAMAALAARKPKARTVPAALKPLKDHLGQLETLLFCARSLNKDSSRTEPLNWIYRIRRSSALAICAVRARMPVDING